MTTTAMERMEKIRTTKTRMTKMMMANGEKRMMMTMMTMVVKATAMAMTTTMVMMTQMIAMEGRQGRPQSVESGTSHLLERFRHRWQRKVESNKWMHYSTQAGASGGFWRGLNPD